MKIYIEMLKESIKENIDNIRKSVEQNNTEKITENIRDILSAEYLKTLGAFFTNQPLAAKAIKQFQTTITDDSIVLDPNCGIGSLLLECSHQLSVCEKLSDTLKQWNHVLRGFDIQADFIEITKLRITLEALHRGAKKDCSIEEAISYLNNIELQDALTLSKESVNNVTHLFMNPPFLAVQAPKRDYWGKGKTNSAAVFFDYYLRLLPENTNIVAILPDVLRSGSNFTHFRRFISDAMRGKLQIWGRFSSNVDVDVFILSGIKTNNNPLIEWNKNAQFSRVATLASEYDVCVGSLVAYRDKQQGQIYPYFHSKNCKTWEVITAVSETKAFSGKTIQPPCILIKRTSSPSDKFRAAAVLIDLPQLIAVENHLIVVTPKDGTLKSCQKLLEILAKQKVNDFLNERIRTRHLTVEVVKSIPLI